jgi:polysaccharide pyruvyl transferase WcaK-like protein
MMKKGNYIALLDPALQDNNRTESKNLGDLIISESVVEILHELFPSKQIVRISTHVEIEWKRRRQINDAFLSFIGGTNLITLDMRGHWQFIVRNGKLVWLFPNIKNLILLGCGWGVGYGNPMHFKTKFFYRRILHPGFVHSLRDQYSADKLHNEAGIKTINTSCPTIWSLPDFYDASSGFSNTCLFTLTDYNINKEADENLLNIIISRFDKIVFFPQGSGDITYIRSLASYQKNKCKIALLPHDYQEFKNFIATNSITYIGTRLHAGIKCMEYKHKSAIIAIDNRAAEIAKDIFLPVCNRGDYSTLKDWLGGKALLNQKLRIPYREISNWKNQFL